MCLPLGGGGSAERIAKEQRRDEVARQNRIKAGMKKIDSIFGGFNENFYRGRAKAYEDYALPEVNRQAGNQRRDLIYALARTGNLDSSAAIDKNAELIGEQNKQRIGAVNKGIELANQTRSNVENTRSGIVAELNATGDNTAAANSGLRALQNLNQPQGFSPLGNLFADFAQTVAAIGSRAGNGYSGFLGNGGGSGLYNNSGTARVVRS